MGNQSRAIWVQFYFGVDRRLQNTLDYFFLLEKKSQVIYFLVNSIKYTADILPCFDKLTKYVYVLFRCRTNGAGCNGFIHDVYIV